MSTPEEFLKHITYPMIELLLKKAASTLHLIVPSGGLLQVREVSTLFIGNFTLCIQLHSLILVFARVTMNPEELSMSSQSFEFRFFHRLYKIVATKDCCRKDNLFNNSKSITETLCAIKSKFLTRECRPICFQQFDGLEQTKNICICDSTKVP